MARNLSGGGIATAIASGVALLFSAVSLYQTVLKQPHLQVYVPPVVHYTRDGSDSAEVFAVPITIANRGARAGTVLGAELDVKNAATGQSKYFYSAYKVDAAYFTAAPGFDWETKRMKKAQRPKAPFSPISVPGQNAFTGTLLFYPKSKPFPKMVTEKGEFTLTVRLKTRFDDDLGSWDIFKPATPEPVTLTVRLPYFSKTRVTNGGSMRMTGLELEIADDGEAPAQETPDNPPANSDQ